MRQLALLYRAAGLVALALALAVAPAVALDAEPMTPQVVAPPEFGVLQFTEDEAWVDLQVPLVDAWKQTLEVVASLNDAVSADLPYLESNGRIIAGDLWIAVEAAGVPSQTWVRIRVAIPDNEPEYGKVRAEIILDAIADRLEPPAPDSNKFSYPLAPVAEGVAGGDYVTNNYYYDYGTDPGYGSYYAPYYAPYYPTYIPAYAPCWPSWCYPYSSWNCGWWGWGWGGSWCNGWGWNWGVSACFGSFCASWNWPWNSWGCGSWWWDDCDNWDDCNDVVVFADGTVVVGAEAPGVLALGPRTTTIGALPAGDLASYHFRRRREAIADAAGPRPDEGLPRVTDRTSRRVAEPAVAVSRTPRSDTAARDVIVAEAGRAVPSAPIRTQTSTSRSTKKDGPRIVKLGSAPYSARVNPAAMEARTSSVPVTTVGGSYPVPSSTSHPYSNPFPTSAAPSSAPSVSYGTPRPSSPAPAPSVSQPRISAPVSQPSRSVSAPTSSRPSISPSSGGGHSSGGGRSSGGSSGGSSSGGRGPR